MKLVIISDTHTLHEQLDGLSGDVLIHCGDIWNGFRPDTLDIATVDDWFGRQDFETIICTGGNHDFAIEECTARGRSVFRNATYLEDRAIEFNGLKFYGAPWIPKLDGWAYYQSDAELREKWELIPDDTDILITHTPPYGVLDLNKAGKPQGCPLLRARIEELPGLQLHAFGHIHEGYGVEEINGVTFVNAALLGGKRLRDPVSVQFSP